MATQTGTSRGVLCRLLDGPGGQWHHGKIWDELLSEYQLSEDPTNLFANVSGLSFFMLIKMEEDDQHYIAHRRR